MKRRGEIMYEKFPISAEKGIMSDCLETPSWLTKRILLLKLLLLLLLSVCTIPLCHDLMMYTIIPLDSVLAHWKKEGRRSSCMRCPLETDIFSKDHIQKVAPFSTDCPYDSFCVCVCVCYVCVKPTHQKNLTFDPPTMRRILSFIRHPFNFIHSFISSINQSINPSINQPELLE